MDTKFKILIVDDDAEVATCFAGVLDKHETHVTTSGAHAIEKIKSTEEYDLVILDYRLSDITGIEVLKEIKKRHPCIPVIIITGYGDEDVVIRSFRHGAKDYLKKPVCFNELRQKVEFFLAGQTQSQNDEGRESAPCGHDAECSGDCHPIIPNDNYKMQKALRFIHENYMERIDLDSVANHVAVSKYHFSKLFKREIGVSFQDYLNCMRIKKAKHLIETKQHSVTEVAFAVGYGDLTYFGRVFKKITGVAPSKCRTK